MSINIPPCYLSAFDLDRTIFCANTSFRFSLHLIREKKMSLSTFFYSLYYYFRHITGGLPLDQMHHKIFRRHLLGFPLAVLQDEVTKFILKIKESDFYGPALMHLRRAKEMGHYTALLSTSPSFLVDPLGELLGFDVIYASVYSADREHKLCKISSVLEGRDKAIKLMQLAKKKGIKKENIIAYSDSFLDLPFLQEAGTPVVVNPDKKLKRISKNEGWLIL